MVETFSAPYMQRALVELLLLAVLAGGLGPWIVLRRLAFFTHAIGTATFPGLVIAGATGITPQALALVTALGFGAGIERLAAGRRIAADAATGLLLVAALGVGVVLASDVFESEAGVDRLLFGSLIGLSDTDVWLTALAAVAALGVDAAARRAWLATGFDGDGARSLGVPVGAADRLLLAAVAVAVVVSLDAVGALLVTVVLVVPAATVRLLEPPVRVMQLLTAALAALEGVGALLLAHALDVGPGPAMAVVGGTVFAATAAGSLALRRPRSAAA